MRERGKAAIPIPRNISSKREGPVTISSLLERLFRYEGVSTVDIQKSIERYLEEMVPSQIPSTLGWSCRLIIVTAAKRRQPPTAMRALLPNSPLQAGIEARSWTRLA